MVSRVRHWPNDAPCWTFGAMRDPADWSRFETIDSNLVAQIEESRVGIAADWIRAVMAGPKGNPLAEPETMVHLVLPALDRLLVRLKSEGESTKPVAWPPRCHCDRNPYREFYVRGESALIKNRMLRANLTTGEIRKLRYVLRTVAAEDIRSFDSVCLFNARAGAVGAR